MINAYLQQIETMLLNITQGVKQTYETTANIFEVEKTNPERYERIRQWLSLAQTEVELLHEEKIISLGYWQEVLDALPVYLDRLGNLQMLAGQNGENYKFMIATHKDSLKQFLSFVLLYSLPLFIEVVEEMDTEERDKLTAVFKKKGKK